jgi:hypothetical protein
MDASERNSLISNIGFSVGIVGGIVGTWLLLTSQPKDGSESRSGERASASVTARLGLGRVNIEGSF